jgi:AcrR family transcriptional regulator
MPNGHRARSQLSTRLVLQAAGDLVAEGGYASMTLATVGERAGYSRSLATARFGSKARMLEALVDLIVTRWNIATVVPRTEGRTGLDGLVILLEAIRDQYRSDPRSLRVLYALMFEALGPNEELRSRFVEFHRSIRRAIAMMIERGAADGSIVEDVDPDVEAQVIVALLRGVGYQWRLDPQEFDPVPPLDHMIATTRARLSVQGHS